MLVALWSMKGGVGVSTSAAILAIARSEHACETVLVDLTGDAPDLLGIAERTGPGLTDWCAIPEHSTDALVRIRRQVAPDLWLLDRGEQVPHGDPRPLAQALRGTRATQVVDCGTAPDAFAQQLIEAADVRLLVVRACYLTLRAASRTPIAPTGAVLVSERGRSLGRSDVERAVGAPIVAEIAVDPAIARLVDAGLVTQRLPRSLVRSLGRVFRAAS